MILAGSFRFAPRKTVDFFPLSSETLIVTLCFTAISKAPFREVVFPAPLSISQSEQEIEPLILNFLCEICVNLLQTITNGGFGDTFLCCNIHVGAAVIKHLFDEFLLLWL